jgi:diacylglycerol kinase
MTIARGFADETMTEQTQDSESSPRKRRRPWREKFTEAFRGIVHGVHGESSFFVHFFVATSVLVVAFVLGCSYVEWCILIGCIGFVLTAELFNSSLERIFRGLDEDTKDRIQHCLDISAGAVLMASITSTIIGAIVLIHRITHMTN